MKKMFSAILKTGLLASLLIVGSAISAEVPKFEKKADLGKGMFGSIRHLCLDKNDNIYVCGDNLIKIFNSDGKDAGGWKTSEPILCAAVDNDGFVYGAGQDKIFKFSNDRKGTVVTSWGNGGKGYGQLAGPSGIFCAGNFVYVCDAGNSCIHKYTKDGKLQEDIGRTSLAAKRGSFATCCGILDAAIAKDGKLYVANLGAHRVEVYQNGKRISYFGKAGATPEDFCGCCNPTNITIANDGKIITSEKDIPRIKIFSPDGKKILLLIDAGNFDKNCANMYVAVNSKNTIYAVDNGTNCIRVFSYPSNL